MSTKKGFFILYSVAGQIMPKIYKSRATITKHLSKNNNLSFYEFPNLKAAESYLQKLTNQKQHLITHKKQKTFLKKNSPDKEKSQIENLMPKKEDLAPIKQAKKQEMIQKPLEVKENPVQELKEQKIQIKSQQTEISESLESISSQKLIHQKDSQISEYLNLTTKKISEQDKFYLIKSYEALNPFYKQQKIAFQSEKADLYLRCNRRQNPGFTTASWKFISKEQTILENKYKVGVTRNNQGIVQATARILMDIILSNSAKTTIKLCLDNDIFMKGRRSLDRKIKEGCKFVDTATKIGFQLN